MRRFRPLALPFITLVLFASCHDLSTAPLSPSRTQPSRSANPIAPGLARYPCFTSELTTGGAYPYRYRRTEIAFPRSAVPASGETTTFRYRVISDAGVVTFLANCSIPASRLALDFVARRLDIPEEAIVSDGPRILEECVKGQTDAQDSKTCPLDPIVVVVPSTTRPAEEVFECTVACGGTSGTPGDGTGAGTGGGMTSCEFCSPDAPILSCTQTVVRGDVVTCTVTAADLPSVGQWSFEGANSQVTAPGGSASWSGPAVESGTVTATLASGTLQSTFTVAPRPWRWANDQASVWTLAERAAPIAVNGYGTQEPVIGGLNAYGWNCNIQQCGVLRRVQPDLLNAPNSGYSVLPVTGGPNAGIYYVSAVNFRMDRGTGMNAEVTASGRLRLLAPGAQADECRQKMGLPVGAEVRVNFYTFNTICKGVNLASFHNGIWSHEGLGSSGSNGHESRARIAASAAQNDMYALVESQTHQDDEELRRRVRDRLKTPQDQVDTQGNSHDGVTGNWTGTFWIWSDADGKYVLHASLTI